MSSTERGDDTVARTTGHVLSDLEPEQKSRIVEEIADEVVTRLKEDDERLAKDVGHAVIDKMPLVSDTTLLKAGTTVAINTWLESYSEEIIEEVGQVIVDEVVESHSDATVERGVSAVVEEVSRSA